MYNVLVLTCLNTVADPKAQLLKLVYFLKKYRADWNILYHNPYHSLPKYVQDVNFDCIILDATFLSSKIYYRDWLKEHLQKNRILSHVRDSDACKLAFPQDDYEYSDVLDEIFCDFNVDVVFSLFGGNFQNLLYPNYSKVGKYELAHTGYIDDDYLLLAEKSKPFAQRKIDVSYRTNKVPPHFGRLGELKWRLADVFIEKFKKYNFVLDISYSEKDIIRGDEWYNFLYDSKFCLGSLSGSSIIDKDGSIRKKIDYFLKKNKDYEYNNFKKEVLPNYEETFMSVISPRNIEAAFAKTCQILVEGPYSEIMAPWDNYIPVKMDWENFDILNEYEIYAALTNGDLYEKITNNTLDLFMSLRAELSYESLCKTIDLIIDGHISDKKISRSDFRTVKLIIEKHQSEFISKVSFESNLKALARKLKLQSPNGRLLKKLYYNLFG